jgi:adenine/guanine phosphoribosyltransferase-like PRPP-binding protein
MITKLAFEGDRSLIVHLRSIAVSAFAWLQGATVLLIDDVVTTGNSIEAARRLLCPCGNSSRG